MDGESLNTRFNSPVVRELFGKFSKISEKFQSTLLFVDMVV